MKEKVKPIKLKSIEEIEKIFKSKEFEAGFKLVEERNKKLIENTKIDWIGLNKPFDI